VVRMADVRHEATWHRPYLRSRSPAWSNSRLMKGEGGLSSKGVQRGLAFVVTEPRSRSLYRSFALALNNLGKGACQQCDEKATKSGRSALRGGWAEEKPFREILTRGLRRD
jgi:hypothetical protein